MAFRRSFRRSRFRRQGQLNWLTAFTTGVINVPATSNVYAPLTLQVEQETSSDQVIQRIRGWISASTVLTSAATIGNVMGAIFVEDAKDLTFAAGANVLPDPRGITLEAVEPDKYMWLGGLFAGALADATPNVIGSIMVDVKAKRKLDVTYQQALICLSNPTAAAVNVSMYLRTLIREVGT